MLFVLTSLTGRCIIFKINFTEMKSMADSLKIRFANMADCEKLLEIYAPYVTGTAITFEDGVPAAEEFAGRIKHVQQKYPYVAAEYNGKIVGYA